VQNRKGINDPAASRVAVCLLQNKMQVGWQEPCAPDPSKVRGTLRWQTGAQPQGC